MSAARGRFTFLDPMKKGTESRSVNVNHLASSVYHVTFLDPMKRGLKETTRCRWSRVAATSNGVTFLDPMKRGLKVSPNEAKGTEALIVTFLDPMKKGTESLMCCSSDGQALVG